VTDTAKPGVERSSESASETDWRGLRPLVSQALESRDLPIPAHFQHDYLKFQRQHNLRPLWLLNLATFTAFLLFAIPDWLIVPDMALPSLLWRCFFFVTLLLPALAIVATVFWFQILSRSQSVYLPILLFTLFVVWYNCHNGRRMFLHKLLERVDAAELLEANQKLWHQSHTDPLTDLPNRTLLEDRVRQALALAQRGQTKMAVIYIDLDHFKPVNDQHGHAAGDQLLIAVAQRMKASVRNSDTVARVGGDEFVVVLSSVQDVAYALAVADKIRVALSQSFVVLPGAQVEVGGSLGVAVYPDHATDALCLYDGADAAMYRAKQSGRNRVEVAGLGLQP